MNIQTTTLKNGITVLAKTDKFGTNAVSYSNKTQAIQRELVLTAQGVSCSLYQAPMNFQVTYIKIN